MNSIGARRTNLRQLLSISRTICARGRNVHSPALQPLPAMTPFVPDTTAFLTLIGRGMSQYAAKIPSWEALFRFSGEQLKESGIESPRDRRYLMWWRDRYRKGIMGIGGDLKEVTDGVAELRIAQVPSTSIRDQKATIFKDAGMKNVIVNMPVQQSKPRRQTNGLVLAAPLTLDASEAQPAKEFHIIKGNVITGKGIEYIKDEPGVARLRVQEGLWEQRRGHKVDGGERRKAEVRFKRRATEKKNAR